MPTSYSDSAEFANPSAPKTQRKQPAFLMKTEICGAKSLILRKSLLETYPSSVSQLPSLFHSRKTPCSLPLSLIDFGLIRTIEVHHEFKE